MLECADGIAVLTLDPSEKSVDLISELIRTFCDLQNDDSLRALIITGAEILQVSEGAQQLVDSIESFPVPVIAAIGGSAVAGGYELALACHLRIASKDARFTVAGSELDATSALQLGLINRVVEPDQVLVESRALAKQIASLAPLAIRACLKAVTEGLKLPFEEGLALERQLFASLFATKDAKEGTRAFLEKRRPKFSGRLKDEDEG